MNKVVKIRSFVAVVIVMATTLIVLDWLRLPVVMETGEYVDNYTISRVLKFLTSLLIGVFVWTSGDDSITPLDSLKLNIAFAIIVLGDFCFASSGIIGNYTNVLPAVVVKAGTVLTDMAVVVFALGQLALVVRNSKDMVKFLKDPKEAPDRKFMLFVTIGLVLFDIALYKFMFYQSMFFTVYSVFLCASVWMAFASLKIDYFSERTSHYIIIGMICLFICDFTVGGGMLSGDNPVERVIYTSLTWIFYTPGLVLLAVSGYSRDK